LLTLGGDCRLPAKNLEQVLGQLPIALCNWPKQAEQLGEVDLPVLWLANGQVMSGGHGDGNYEE
jgi:hypothetical protein